MSTSPGISSDAELKQTVNLIISAKDVEDTDNFSKSDPMCVVWIESADGWMEHDRTETIKNTLNPEFSKRIGIEYHFEQLQKLKFSLYDIDDPTLPLDRQDLLGEATCTMGQIVHSGRLLFSLAPRRGQIIIESQDMSKNRDYLDFCFSTQQLTNSRQLSEPNPFLELHRISPKGHKTLIHRTETVKHTRQPDWAKFSVPLCLLEKDGAETKILIECFDERKRSGDHKLIGQVQLSSRYLYRAPKYFELIKMKKGAEKRGQLTLQESAKRVEFAFLDYVYSGIELNCVFAIDFTLSNNDPRLEKPLHYYDDKTPSQYEVALRSVGEIIQDYDSDQQFPVLGFGARVPPTNQVSHEFFVNLSPSPFCSGVDGVVEAYRRCLQSVTLYGPTNFAPILRHVVSSASPDLSNRNYFILLIMTDGAVSDMEATKMALVDASDLPISVIIVGIGEADFSSMNELKGDSLSVNERTAQRDIVQFVAFKDYLKYGNQLGHYLAKDLLAKVPTQLVSFMKSNDISPL